MAQVPAWAAEGSGAPCDWAQRQALYLVGGGGEGEQLLALGEGMSWVGL